MKGSAFVAAQEESLAGECSGHAGKITPAPEAKPVMYVVGIAITLGRRGFIFVFIGPPEIWIKVRNWKLKRPVWNKPSLTCVRTCWTMRIPTPWASRELRSEKLHRPDLITECWGPHRKRGVMDIQPTCPDLCLLTSRPRRLPLGSSNVLVHHCQLLAGKHIRGLSQQLHNPQGSGACSRPNVAMAHSSRSSVGCCSWLIAQIYSLDHTVLHSPPTPWFLSHSFLFPSLLSFNQ